jgi:hypothetical protein
MAEQDRDTSSANETVHQQDSSGRQDERRNEARRELLKKLGRYALYTAPALLAMFETIETAAAS